MVGVIGARMDSFRRALLSSGLLVFTLVHSGAPRVRRVHSVSLALTWELLKFVEYIRLRVGSLGCA